MRLWSPSTPLALATLLALSGSATAWAVELNATVKGTVTDEYGDPVPNAHVLLTSPDLLGGRELSTDPEGRFRFPALPPGSYTLMIQHGSFADWESGNLQVNLGATISLDVQLSLRDSGETITVVDKAPAIDVESTRSGGVLDARTLKDIPTARDFQDASSIVPGVVGGGDHMRGGFDSSNQYYLDGVNITDPLTNTFSMNMNYDAIESIQVITGGMDAEYGRSLGGAVNIVTKSGGNNFEGSAFLLYSPPSFVIAPRLDGDAQNTDLDEQITLNLGGPILKDKVWFFASLQGDRSIRTQSIDTSEIPRDLERFPLVPRDWRSLYIFGKITAQPTPAHRFWVQLQSDPTWIDNVEQSPYTLPSGETVQNQGGWLGSIGHVFMPNEKLLLESQVYYQRSYINYYSILWKDCGNFDERGACTDDFVGADYMGEPVSQGWLAYDTGFSSGEYPYASLNRRQRGSINSALTAWFDLLGEHQAKVGVQGEILHSYYVYPGLENGVPYYDLDEGADINDLDAYSPALLEKYDNDQEASFTGYIVSWYLQDAYKPHERLTLRPGVRFDWTGMNDDTGNPVFSRLTVAPRFGAVLDVTGDGKTAIRGYYGRFFDSGFLAIADILRKKSSGVAYYSWDRDTNDWATDPDFASSSRFLKHPDLRNPYSDEFQIGFARELAPDLGLDISFVHEIARNFWEDDEVNLIWNDDGTDVIGSRNGSGEAVYRLRTPDDVFTRYTSIEMSLVKQFSDNWTLRGSYTWSRAYGTNDADQATAIHDIPPQYKYEVGLLSYDVTHNVKLAGSYTEDSVYRIGPIKGGFVLGWNFILRSGYPYRRLLWNDYYQSYSNYEAPNSDRYRLPAVGQLDLRAGLNFTVGPTSWMAGIDMFNVFNGRTVTGVDVRYDPDATGDDQTFGDTLGRQGRRRIQFIARGEF